MGTLRKALRLFEKKFPQILLSVLVTELPAQHPVGEFAFWMANRARFSSVEKVETDNFDLLLTVDVASQKAALVTGYGLEPFVQEEDLQVALEALARAMQTEKLAPSIHVFLEALTKQLRQLSLQAKAPRSTTADVS